MLISHYKNHQTDRSEKIDEGEFGATRSKVAGFVINRIEAERSKETGIICTRIVPRPSDSYASFEFASTVPEGSENIGRGCPW